MRSSLKLVQLVYSTTGDTHPAHGVQPSMATVETVPHASSALMAVQFAIKVIALIVLVITRALENMNHPTIAQSAAHIMMT